MCDHVKTILQYAVNVKASTLLHLSRVLAALTYGNRQKMAILTDHFNSVMDFDTFDQDRKQEDEHNVSYPRCLLDDEFKVNSMKGFAISVGVVLQHNVRCREKRARKYS